MTIFGFGATTGVAWLLMFFGAEPPSFSFGFARCVAAEAEEAADVGADRDAYALRIAEIDFARQMEEGEQQRAWIATTATIAPLVAIV